MLATLLAAVSATVLVVGASSPTAEATPVAPVAPLPKCVNDEDGDPGLGCAPNEGQFGAKVEGLFNISNTFTVVTTGTGLDWCEKHTSTGCLYSLGDPNLVRCVYLHEDDPTDVRGCGSLSTTGQVGLANAQRQGTCRGELGSVYVYGGPAPDPSTWWNARAPKLARCEFKVESPHLIDNLDGPTFMLVATHATECVQQFGNGCDEASTVYEHHVRYVWVPVNGTLAPRVSFDWSKGAQPGEITFDNTSVPYDGAVTWDWDFDDNDAYSTEFEPTHTFEESGVYRVELTMTGPQEGPQLSTTRNVVVNLENADMMVKVYDPGVTINPDDPNDPEPGYDLGDLFVARIEVYNIGDDDLFDVRPVAALLDMERQVEAITAFPTTTPFTLEPGSSRSFSVQLRVVDIGHFSVWSRWTGNDQHGIPVDTRQGELTGVVKGPDLAPLGDLTVTVEPTPAALETADGAGPVAVSTLVTIENKSPDKFYSEVALSGPLGWSALYADSAVATVDLDFADPAAVSTTFGPADEVELGPLAPGESHTYTYDLVADGEAHALLRQLVRAETPTGDTYRVGTHTLRIGSMVVDAEPVVPARLLDTRIGEQFTTVDGLMQGMGRMGAGTILELPVVGRGGIEPDAPAVILNVTSIAPDGPGYLTVFPCGEERPVASNVNYTGGQVVPNQVLAKVGVGGKVCIFTLAGTDLVVDANGYVPEGGELETMLPARLLETRPGRPTVDGQMQGIGRVAAGSVTELVVGGRAGIAPDAATVVLNVTAILPEGPGYLTVFPCGEQRPVASNVNYVAGDVVPNAVTTKVGAGGAVCIYSKVATDLVVDANGFVPAGGELTTVVPARLLETRPGESTVDGESQGQGPAAAGSVTEVRVAGRGGVDPAATAVFLNVTAVVPEAPGYLTVFPCGEARPTASNVNYGPGAVVPNAVLAKVGEGGRVCIYTLAATHVIVDVNGYVPAPG